MRLRNPPVGIHGSIINNFALDEVVRELYFDDNIEAAWEHGLERGLSREDVRFYRLLEAEHLTRQRAVILSIEPQLSLEYDPNEKGFDPEVTPYVVRDECNALARRFQWKYDEAIRVTILTTEVDTPWSYYRAGYCVDKYPYEKVCIPAYSLHAPNEFGRILRHEFMHAVTLNVCNGHEPVWLTEGLSVLVENQIRSRYWMKFKMGLLEWRTAMFLNGGIDGNRWDQSEVDRIRQGYEQAYIVVSYLHKLEGDKGLIALMKAIGDESVARNVKRTILGQSNTDSALRSVFDLSEEAVFQEAYKWLQSVPF